MQCQVEEGTPDTMLLLGLYHQNLDIADAIGQLNAGPSPSWIVLH